MDTVWQDLRFAARTLTRAPGLAIVAVLTLALGIGANSAAFSLVNAILLQPLPFAEPQRLTMLYENSRGFDHGTVSPHEFVISETMAKNLWPGEDALGKRFRVLFSPWVTVIGIVGDVKQAGLQDVPAPEMYLSDLQEPSADLTLVLRSAGDPLAMAHRVSERIRAVDANLPVTDLQPMDGVVWSSVAPPRFNATLIGISGVVALVLALIGVYGVILYAVDRRTHEIGIRRALGAQTRDVLRLVPGQAMTLVAIGVGIGLAGALALTRVLTTLLFDVAPTDPATFASVALSLAGVAFAAGYIPGRRATRVDPTDALKAE